MDITDATKIDETHLCSTNTLSEHQTIPVTAG